MSGALSIFAAARECPRDLALVVPERGVTLRFGELAERVAGALAGLVELDLVAGRPVAFFPHARLETLIVLLALAEAGFPFVPIHPRLVPAERARLLDALAPVTFLDDAAIDALGAAPAAPVPASPRVASPEELFAIVPTSGTSGAPKGVLLPRRSFVASAQASAAHLGFLPSDRWLLGLPLAHVGGLSVLTRCVLARRPVVLLSRFDPTLVLETLANQRVTLLSAVPTMLASLLDADREGVLSRLRILLLGGAAAPLPLLQEAASRGIRALPTYGLTEACSQVTTQPLRDPPRALPGVGRPLLGIRVAVADAQGHPVARGDEGRIWVAGPTLFRGYFGEPPRADEPFDTGDLGHVDGAGDLHIHGRRTDLLVTGGENVRPAEVEAVLLAFEGVRGALVFGVEDGRWGQLVAAAIVWDAAVPFEEGALVDFLAAQLAPHKRPRRLALVDRLPETPLGKPDRRGAAARLGVALRPLRSR